MMLKKQFIVRFVKKFLHLHYFKRLFIRKDLKSSLFIDIQIFFYFLFKHKLELKIPVIVSLTSYPARINTVKYTIFSLLRQNIMPEKIILWLGETQFPNQEGIPLSLLKFQGDLFEIKFTDDIKSYTKLIPALKNYPDKIIVTADDDIYYGRKWLSILWEAHLLHKNEIIAHRGYTITVKDHEILPYEQWELMKKNTASVYNFLTGVGGILYPPHCFFHDIDNQELFMKLAPYADDVWFYFMIILNNKKVFFPENAIPLLVEIDKSLQKEKFNPNTLKKLNILQKQNDIQIQSMVKYYYDNPIIQNILANK